MIKPEWPDVANWTVDISKGNASAELSDGSTIEVRRESADCYALWLDNVDRYDSEVELLNIFEAIEHWKRWWNTD